VTKGFGAGYRLELNSGARERRVGFPKAVGAAKVGQPRIDAKTGSGSDKKAVRTPNELCGFGKSVKHRLASGSLD
jgi:hypothetical protein